MMLKKHAEDLKENSYWLGSIDEYLFTGMNPIKDYEQIVNSITVKDIQKFTDDLFKDGTPCRNAWRYLRPLEASPEEHEPKRQGLTPTGRGNAKKRMPCASVSKSCSHTCQHRLFAAAMDAHCSRWSLTFICQTEK